MKRLFDSTYRRRCVSWCHDSAGDRRWTEERERFVSAGARMRAPLKGHSLTDGTFINNYGHSLSSDSGHRRVS